MKSIDTLIPDIRDIVRSKGGWNENLFTEFGLNVSDVLRNRFGEQSVKPASLRMSRLGSTCPRALWYSIHHPELAEPLPAWTEVKFLFGDLIEQLAITLAKAAGHHVCGEQDELVLDGVTGHRDCVIDGCVVDVKSAASRSFQKFKDGTLYQNDTFGYLDQLDGYVVASSEDPLVTVKDKGYLFVIDKQLGHMCLYQHKVRETHIRKRVADYKSIVDLTRPPNCTCETVEDGASGNVKLGVQASYSSFKYCCFPHLRAFLYSNGPVYLTKVVRKPYDAKLKRYITEVDKHGQFVYS